MDVFRLKIGTTGLLYDRESTSVEIRLSFLLDFYIVNKKYLYCEDAHDAVAVR